MPFFIDTHSHIYLPEFDTDRTEVVSRALEKGVQKMLLPNIDSSTVEPMTSMVHAFPGTCYAMMGLHPGSVKENYMEEISRIKEALLKQAWIGIGEIGIDLYWDKTFLKEQSLAFAEQIDWSLKYDLPVVIHARESFDEILEILQGYRDKVPRGIFHAFTGTPEIAEKVLSMGFKLGIGGIVTYKNSTLPMVIKDIPLEHLVLETDSPYLTPVPYRGRRNESSYIYDIAQAVATIKNVHLDEVANVTMKNTTDLFFPEHVSTT